MAMTIAGMAAAIEAQFAVPVTSKAQFSLAMATAVVNYLKSNAEILPTSATPLLVGPGLAAGSTVVGKGTID